MQEITVLGIDLAKKVFQLHGVNRQGRAVLRKKVSRGELRNCIARLPKCLIAMEACAGSHYWAPRAEQELHTRMPQRAVVS